MTPRRIGGSYTIDGFAYLCILVRCLVCELLLDDLASFIVLTNSYFTE